MRTILLLGLIGVLAACGTTRTVGLTPGQTTFSNFCDLDVRFTLDAGPPETLERQAVAVRILGPGRHTARFETVDGQVIGEIVLSGPVEVSLAPGRDGKCSVQEVTPPAPGGDA